MQKQNRPFSVGPALLLVLGRFLYRKSMLALPKEETICSFDIYNHDLFIAHLNNLAREAVGVI